MTAARRSLFILPPLLIALSIGACAGDQSSIDPAGPQADAIAEHLWFFIAVCTVVYAAVVAALVHALFRRNRPEVAESRDGRMRTVVASAAGVTVVIVIGFLVHAVWTGRELAALTSEEMLTIEVVGNQWWWQVQYKKGDTPYITTANEIHIPVGEPVRFELTARDVIHSFWIPNLHGKKDLIPGKTTSIVLQADRPGVYRGQCAEFCGLQHAKMAFLVIAQPPEEYQQWALQQQRSAREPVTPEQTRGMEVFVSSQCMVCHTIRGTTARGATGPDLTHLASRRTIGAATLPNRRGHLGGWILDPHSVKAGVRMPPNQFESDDFHALLSYLESLH